VSGDWQRLTAYLAAQDLYDIKGVDNDLLFLQLRGAGEEDVPLGVIKVQRGVDADGDEWMCATAALGRPDHIEWPGLLLETSRLICGGISGDGEIVTFRHTMPLRGALPEFIDFAIHQVAYGSENLLQKFVSITERGFTWQVD
jgi:hypothetical protein